MKNSDEKKWYFAVDERKHQVVFSLDYTSPYGDYDEEGPYDTKEQARDAAIIYLADIARSASRTIVNLIEATQTPNGTVKKGGL